MSNFHEYQTETVASNITFKRFRAHSRDPVFSQVLMKLKMFVLMLSQTCLISRTNLNPFPNNKF